MKNIVFFRNPKSVKTGAVISNQILCDHLTKNKNWRLIELRPNKTQCSLNQEIKTVGYIAMFLSLAMEKDILEKADLCLGTSFAGMASVLYGKPLVAIMRSTGYGEYKTMIEFNQKPTKELKISQKWEKILGIKKDEEVKNIHKIVGHAEQFTINHANKIVAVSQSIKKELITLYNQPDSKIVIIHNSVDDKWLESLHNSTTRKPRILGISRLSENQFGFRRKGIGIALEIMSAFSDDYESLFIGQARESSTISRKLAEHKIKFLPNLENKAIKKEIRVGDIFLFTSIYEPFGRTVMETMSRGAIPIGFDAGAVKDCVIHGKNGFIAKNYQDIIKYTKELLANQSRRIKVGQAARETAQKFFTTRKMIKEYQRCIEEILSAKN